MRHIDGDPRAMLTVIAEDIEPYAALSLPPGVRVDRDDETLMTVGLSASRRRTRLGVTSRWDITGNCVTLRLEIDDRSPQRARSACSCGTLSSTRSRLHRDSSVEGWDVA